MEHITDELVRLSYFADIGTAIARARTLREVLQKVMHHIGNSFAPSYWSLLLRNMKTGDLRFTLVTGSGVESLKGQTIPRGKGIAGWIAENAQPVIVEDVERDERFDNSADAKTNFQTKSVIGVPLKSGERVFGVIELINTLERQPFNALDLKILNTIAEFAAISIERVYYFRALRRLSRIDPLTGAYNRRSFEVLLDRELSRTKRHDTVCSLLLIDVDKFKQINDRYGHAAGDQVLIAVAELLKSNLRDVDHVCRYGGDEFVVILPDTDVGQAGRLKKRLISIAEDTSTQLDVPFTISVGVHDSRGESAARLLRGADQDMYKSKQERFEQTAEDLGRNLQAMLDAERSDATDSA